MFRNLLPIRYRRWIVERETDQEERDRKDQEKIIENKLRQAHLGDILINDSSTISEGEELPTLDDLVPSKTKMSTRSRRTTKKK